MASRFGLAESWPAIGQLVFDISHRCQRVALILRVARRGSEGQKGLFTQTIELHGAEGRCSSR